MKPKPFHILVLTAALTACDEPVLFTEPQPQDKSSLAQFPERWQGSYLSEGDSSLLEIGPHIIRVLRDWTLRDPLSAMDGTVQLRGDTVIEFGPGITAPVTVRNDSIFGTLHITDSLFAIGDHGILKRMSGNLFLNRSDNGSSWEVTQLTLSGGRLRINKVRDPASLAAIKEVIELPGDTISAPLSITRKQFRGIIRHGGFQVSDEYIRVRSK